MSILVVSAIVLYAVILLFFWSVLRAGRNYCTKSSERIELKRYRHEEMALRPSKALDTKVVQTALMPLNAEKNS